MKVRSFALAAPIIDALELGDPNLVRRITLRRTEVEVETYRLRDGKKFVDETNEPATMIRRFEVQS